MITLRGYEKTLSAGERYTEQISFDRSASGVPSVLSVIPKNAAGIFCTLKSVNTGEIKIDMIDLGTLQDMPYQLTVNFPAGQYAMELYNSTADSAAVKLTWVIDYN